MKREDQIRNQRLNLLKTIQEKGINPYPSRGKRTHSCNDIKVSFKKLNNKKVMVVGRIMAIRTMGKISFFTIKDFSGTLQVLFRQDNLGKINYKDLKIFDTGDFIEVSGIVTKTKAGEISVDVKKYRLLSKSLRPLPEKFHGLKDIETRYRKRYLDFLINNETREKIIKRAKIISAVRGFLEKNGFLEIQFPILEAEATGAAAKPFKTHYDVYDTDVFLRICIGELWQKRAIVGGFEKIFEIGKAFRNEGVSSHHNPDFLMCEFYWAYADYNDMISFTEKLISSVVKEVNGKLQIEYQNRKIDFKPPYPRYSFKELMKKKAKIDMDKFSDKESLIKEFKRVGFKFNRNDSYGTLIDKYYKEKVRPNLIGPVFLIDHPVEISPLAKLKEKNKGIVERAQLIVCGMEITNGYSELNDPIDQKERLVKQAEALRAGDEEAQRIDEDYIEAMEYGMPPIAGNGIGMERLIMLLTNSATIREIIPFPFMKPEKGPIKNN